MTVLSGERVWDKPKASDWPSTPEGEAFQAREAVRFYTMLFSHPAVEAITWWDFADWHAWKGAPAGFLRKDMTPKPMYDELLRRIKGTWLTKAKLGPSGADGTASFRGFLGDYKVVVTVNGKKAVETQMTLKKGEVNRWEVKVL
jgi:endo-1,4-beta-xylanase